jgi:hypothetical protein
LDEHVPRALQIELLRQEPALKVWKVGDAGAPLRGTLDPEILLWLERSDFLLVTNNRRSMPVHLADHLAAGHHVPGIFTLNMDLGMARTAEDLIVIANASFEGEYRDLIKYLPLT